MKDQVALLNEILRLKAENPECEIHFLVDSQELCDMQYTNHSINRVELGVWFQDNETILTDIDEVFDWLNEKQGDPCTDDELMEEAKSKSPKAIIVYTEATPC